MSGRITVLVGTTKGLFCVDRDEAGATWTLRGPFCGGGPVNHAIGDPETGTLWAGGGGEWEGAGVWRSEDGGLTWTLSKLSNGQGDAWIAENPEIAAQVGMEAALPASPAPFTGTVTAVWSLARAEGTLYAGTKPAALLASRDGGASWARVDGLTDHPSRESWFPGAAGLVLHTIVADPDAPRKLWVGISAAGVFASEDGGATWERRNRRSDAGIAAAEAAPPPAHPAAGTTREIGHCVHNLVRAPEPKRDLLYQQNHHGVFRSGDGGRTWEDVTAGLPSTFGFPVAVHPRDPGTLWVLPLNGDTQGRYPPGGRPAVWRSRDGGATWADLRDGLPERDCFFTVLRQAMATDRRTPAGVYFGTTTGSVFASPDEGETWSEIARHLPTVLCVETLERAA